MTPEHFHNAVVQLVAGYGAMIEEVEQRGFLRGSQQAVAALAAREKEIAEREAAGPSKLISEELELIAAVLAYRLNCGGFEETGSTAYGRVGRAVDAVLAKRPPLPRSEQ